jgi:hypothetical protein
LSKAHISPRAKKAELVLWRKASLVELRLNSNVEGESNIKGAEPKGGGIRGDIAEFTGASRRRMLEMMARVETSEVPFFVTLTYPDNFPLYSEKFKRDLETLCARLLRRWPKAAVIWKLEFKERRSGRNKGKVAPHYHLFVYNVPWRFQFREEHGQAVTVEMQRLALDGAAEIWVERASAEGAEARSPAVAVWCDEPEGGEFEDGVTWGCDTFVRWVSRAWFDVVQSGDIRHFHAGTKVERLRSVSGAFAYASKKYAGKKVEEQFKEKPGRYWGVVGRKNLKFGQREVRTLTEKEAVRLRRVIRRYRVSKTAPEKRKLLLRWREMWCGEEFAVKLLCNVECWRERLERLVGDG